LSVALERGPAQRKFRFTFEPLECAGIKRVWCMKRAFGSLVLCAVCLAWPGYGVAQTAALGGANRATWGVAPAMPVAGAPLPAAAQAQIDALRISQVPPAQLVREMDAQRRQASQIADPTQREAALKAWQRAMSDLEREAATRSLLRDLYSSDQPREQMTWFWFNQFNVHAQKRDIRAMVGDYEDTIRAHALGHFRDLLEATLRHPAMLRYLDNDQNAVGRINENYAREIMELHTLGVGAGYTQKDVQELARILTGVGIRLDPDAPRLRPEWQALYQRQGLFEFNPARHDFGVKQFMGHTIAGSGYGEVSQALDIIANSPITARRMSTRIATYYMGDAPPGAVVDRMVAAWQRSRGDIATVLQAMTTSPEYAASPGRAFKDPMHYVVSAVRMAYGAGGDGRTILNVDPMLGWLRRMGETPYGHETPDGYALGAGAWTAPGQMAIRFEIAKAIGNGSAGLFRPRGEGVSDRPAFPQLQNALWYGGLGSSFSPQTRGVLDQAGSPQEWNMLLLSSPDFMRR